MFLDFDKVVEGINRKRNGEPPAVTEEFTQVRRSQRVKKPVVRTDPSDPVSIEDPIVKKRPNKKYEVRQGGKLKHIVLYGVLTRTRIYSKTSSIQFMTLKEGCSLLATRFRGCAFLLP